MPEPRGPDPWHGLPPERRRPKAERRLVEMGLFEPAMAAHDGAVERGDPGYLDPVTGLFVMTAVTLWDRGTCCLSGCRHCPYGPSARVSRRDQEVDGTT